MSVLHLTKKNFEQEVLQAKEPVLVDFWASWCGPCQMVGPVVEEVAGEVTDAKICKVDVDDQPELARPVSYTHLDVYKRQMVWSTEH